MDEKKMAPCEESKEAKTDRELATAIVDMLRPYHLTIFDIRRILRLTDQRLEYVVLREKLPEKE